MQLEHENSDYALSNDFYEKIIQAEKDFKTRKVEEPVGSEPYQCSLEEGCLSCGS